MSYTPKLWRLEGTIPANSPAGTMVDLDVYIPDILAGTEKKYAEVQLNYSFKISDGYAKSAPTTDWQLIIIANDGQKIFQSVPVSQVVMEAGKPRSPLFVMNGKPMRILVRPNTKLKFRARTLAKAGSSDESISLILKID